MTLLELTWLLLEDALFAALAALGFAMLFNVPRRALAWCALGGALGHMVRTLSVVEGVDIIPATLAGATAVGFFGYWLSRRFIMPMPVFTVPGAIPLVPGSIAFQTMANLVNAVNAGIGARIPFLIEASVGAVETALILITLGIGISAPILLFRRHRPVV